MRLYSLNKKEVSTRKKTQQGYTVSSRPNEAIQSQLERRPNEAIQSQQERRPNEAIVMVHTLQTMMNSSYYYEYQENIHFGVKLTPA